MKTAPSDEVGSMNVVKLRGRVSRRDEERELPSGSVVLGFAVVVARETPSPTGRATVDSLDCAAWTAGVRRSVRSWEPGDVVEIEGRLRRRFYRAGGATASRYEVEVVRAKRIARSASA